MKKLYILDTNVLLYDPKSIYNFTDGDIIIPLIILDELDKFKKGNDITNLNARTVIRDLEKKYKAEGTALSKKTTLHIDITDYNSHHADEVLLKAMKKYAIKHNPVLVSKDINLRLKAKALKVEVQDYEIEDTATDYTGYKISDEIVETIPNEYLLCNNIIYRNNQQILSQTAANIKPRNFEQTIALDALLSSDIKLVTLTGTSGAGKTLLALAAAIAQKRNYLQIYLSKPTVPVEHDLGFLPGTIDEKMQPYMESFFDNLEVIKHSYQKDKVLTDMITNHKVQISPITYIRGRSLPRIFFIIDEAQNLTPHGIKSIITRAGEGTKIVLLGDVNQIDSPYLNSKTNGLSYLIHKMKGNSLYAHITLKKGERSTLAELASNIL